MPDPVVKTRLATLAEVRKPASEGRLYAILDCCDAPVIYAKVREMDESQAVCLYRGKLNPDVLAEAPYLVRATPDLVDWIEKTAWKTPWGIFVVANTDLRSLRKHFRRFFTVADDKGDAVYFRYYDPRVLSVYLPTCTDEELRVFLGPVLAFGVGDPKAATVTYFLREGAPVAAEQLPRGAILQIRPMQMKAFSDAAAKRFEVRMVDHLQARFPTECTALGDDRLHRLIRKGVDKARYHGFKTEQEICLYIELMLLLGDGFDTDATLPWTALILAEQPEEPKEKIKRLYEASLEYMRESKRDKGQNKSSYADDKRSQ